MGYLARTFEATMEENRRVILESMPRRAGATLLDLGCGPGGWTMRVADHLATTDVHGVEFIEDWAERARAAGVDVVVADLGERLPFEGESFDVIHSNQVIEHLPRTDHFMREIRRLLRPGGYALISTNNLSSWHNVASLILGWQPPPCHVSDEMIAGNPANIMEGESVTVQGQTHLRVFTGRGLSALARHHGLAPEVERGAGYYPLPSALARPLARLDRRHAAYLVHRFVPVTA